jgi:hypothetical protein
MGRPKGAVKQGTGCQVRLNREVTRKAKLVISQGKAKKLGEYISELVAPAVEQDYIRTLSRLKGGP